MRTARTCSLLACARCPREQGRKHGVGATPRPRGRGRVPPEHPPEPEIRAVRNASDVRSGWPGGRAWPLRATWPRSKRRGGLASSSEPCRPAGRLGRRATRPTREAGNPAGVLVGVPCLCDPKVSRGLRVASDRSRRSVCGRQPRLGWKPCRRVLLQGAPPRARRQAIWRRLNSRPLRVTRRPLTPVAWFSLFRGTTSSPDRVSVSQQVSP
jgi:hypothetical protein